MTDKLLPKEEQVSKLAEIIREVDYVAPLFYGSYAELAEVILNHDSVIGLLIESRTTQENNS